MAFIKNFPDAKVARDIVQARTGLRETYFALVSLLVTTHVFETELWLPVPREKVFPFFADARNLETITPPWLNFQILTPGEIEMHAGAVIDYKLRIHGVPVRWRTKITGWNPPLSFCDEQRRGPYRLWRHTHTFAEKNGGTLCKDVVEYAVPGGALANYLFVRREVEKIFAYRARALKNHFGVKN